MKFFLQTITGLNFAILLLHCLWRIILYIVFRLFKVTLCAQGQERYFIRQRLVPFMFDKFDAGFGQWTGATGMVNSKLCSIGFFPS